MAPVTSSVPSAWSSNLVFASDGRRIFGLDASGDLGSVRVPESPSDSAGPVVREHAASGGAIVVAGWLEGRLATAIVRGGDLELSHGEYGLNLAPSRPAQIPLAETGFRRTASRRLDPYLRWWQEVSPEEEL